jgi:hypothetical protein
VKVVERAENALLGRRGACTLTFWCPCCSSMCVLANVSKSAMTQQSHSNSCYQPEGALCSVQPAGSGGASAGGRTGISDIARACDAAAGYTIGEVKLRDGVVGDATLPRQKVVGAKASTRRRVGACAWSSTTPPQLPAILAHTPALLLDTLHTIPSHRTSRNHVTEIRFQGNFDPR